MSGEYLNSHLLIVEDDVLSQTILEKILGGIGYNHVEVVADAESALDKVCGDSVDLLLLDITLPMMDGYELSKIIMQRPHPPGVVVVSAVSGITETDLHTYGWSGYVEKPFTSDTLELHIIRALMTRNEQHIIEQNRLANIGFVAASIVHEFNNHLAVVRGYAQVGLRLYKELLDKANDMVTKKKDFQAWFDTIVKGGDYFKAIDTEITRGSLLAQNILSLSRKETDKKTMVSIDDIIDATIELRRTAFFETRLCRNYGKPPLVYVDYRMVQGSILNILTNAKFYMSDNDTLTVSTYTENKHVIAAFCNTGSYIAPEYQQRVFDAFFTTKKECKGTGIGLDLVKQTMQCHGGTVSVTSTQNPPETTFYLTFPIVDSHHNADF